MVHSTHPDKKRKRGKKDSYSKGKRQTQRKKETDSSTKIAGFQSGQVRERERKRGRERGSV